MLWRANRFQTRGTLSLHDVLKNSDGKLSNQDQGKLFTQVQADRNACKIFMEQIIQSSIVIVSQQMGLQIPCDNTKTTFRLCVTYKDVVRAIRSIVNFYNKAAAIHFLTVYWRDTLYPKVLNTTHQHETEKAFIAMHNIKVMNIQMISPRHKTCIASMYGECFNDLKQKLNRAIFGSQGLSISVVSKYVEQEKNYKRNKQMFYINDNNKKESKMVRNIDH